MTKLSLSLKTYIAAIFSIICLLIVIGYSLLSNQFFFRGMDNIISANMAEVLEEYLNNKIKPLPQKIRAYYLSSTWDDQPEVIRSVYQKAPEKLAKLYVYHDNSKQFSRRKIYFLITFEVSGQRYYISRIGPSATLSSLVRKNHHQSEKLLFFVSISSSLILFLIIWLLIRKISRPISELNAWTNHLTPENLDLPPPDFVYPELNQQALLIQNSLKSVNETLQREEQFLRFTSHELRTPITVIRNNIQLAHKLNALSVVESDCKHNEIIDRIDRASLTMQYLTETLLWLNRHDIDTLPTQTVALNTLLETITDELRYLLNNKAVDIELSLSPYQTELPIAATRIVLGNLIRNAFQHTWQGSVIIVQHQNQITITNHCDQFTVDNKTDDLGFGLGLSLTQKLCERLAWPYTNQIIADGHLVQLSLKTD